MTDIFKQTLATPQVARWQHEGVECAIHYMPQYDIRNGYCFIPDGHPLEQSDVWDDPFTFDTLLDVHGGVTFGPEKTEGGHVVGFDTNHFRDYSAISNPLVRRWSLDDVIEETNRMAVQIARAGERAA